MRNFPEYLVELDNVEPLPQAGEYAWELHFALYRLVVLGMFRFVVSYDDHNIVENLQVYYVISRPKPEKKEGTVALYPFGEIGTSRPGLLELIHIKLLSIAQVTANEEEDLQFHLRTASAPRRSYHSVVILDYIVWEAEKVVSIADRKSFWPPSSYPKPVALRALRKTPKKRRRQPSPEAQGSRVGPEGEVDKVERVHKPDPVPESKATPIEGPPRGEVAQTSRFRIRGSPPEPAPQPPLLPDLNLDGAGPSLPAGGGGVGRVPYPASGPPILARPFRLCQPRGRAPVIDLSSSSEPNGPPDRCRVHGGACYHKAQSDRRGPAS
ncbi:hypothetical protein CBR_g39152 [Chara braunii]|uniref:Uncharacterized protein n=1 Tax=Chara braunii TaxID=69332 RepID=A0A388LR90_CHABU|nr:hypothetical protein CBR_g39152 [Chara braunii]|eukprot:GBG84775.1 hypothetical protein CBR_g39152 [Chara braunii]